MKRSRLWTGLASVCSFLLTTSILGMNCMMSYAGTVNGALGISTSRVVNEDGADAEDTTYFESEYGELNAENLQTLISDTYAESVTEQEEGSVLSDTRWHSRFTRIHLQDPAVIRASIASISIRH